MRPGVEGEIVAGRMRSLAGVKPAKSRMSATLLWLIGEAKQSRHLPE
jgi:hypothetical protein